MGDRKPLSRLKPWHLKFCDLYAQFVPPPVAYARAFDKGGGPDRHPGNAARLLREPLIQAEIKRLMPNEMSEAGDPLYVAYRRRLVRAELDRVAFFRLPDILDAEGKLRPLSELTDDQRAALAEIAFGDDGPLKVKAHSKDAALTQLMKLDGLGEPEKLDVRAVVNLSRLSDDELDQLGAIIAAATNAQRDRAGEAPAGLTFAGRDAEA